MNKPRKWKIYLFPGLIVTLFTFMSGLSFTSIRRAEGDARVINYAGIVRGAPQKLVKQELQGSPMMNFLWLLKNLEEFDYEGYRNYEKD